MRLLKYGRNVLGEKRSADFLRYFDREVETTRIVSFGSCNFHCGYCKRDGQQVDNDGNIVRSVEVTNGEIITSLLDFSSKGERIRLSGGDPVMHPKDAMEIAKAIGETGKKISMAHNGSSLRFSEMMAPYMDYVAIDLKGDTPEELAFRSGISERSGKKMLESTLEVQDMFSSAGVLVDVRTPVFGDTSLDQLFRMAELIMKGGNNDLEFWTLRKYNTVRHCDWLEPRGETLSEYARLVSEKFPELPIGLREKWSNSGFTILKNGQEV
jgi:pyruvate formate lyase activating enzyme